MGFAGMSGCTMIAAPVVPRAMRLGRFRGLSQLLEARTYCLDAPSEMPAGSVQESGMFLGTHHFVFQSTFLRE